MNTTPTANEIAASIASKLPFDRSVQCGEGVLTPHQMRSLMAAAKRDGQTMSNRKATGVLPNGLTWEAFFYSESVYETAMSKKASDTIDTLTAIVEQVGTERDADYWNPTPGNAGYALSILLGWARQHPDATWHVS